MMIKMASCQGDVREKSRYFYLGFFPHHAQYDGILANGSGEGVWRSEGMMIKMASCRLGEREKSRYFYLGFFPHHAQYDGILANGSWGRGYGGVRN